MGLTVIGLANNNWVWAGSVWAWVWATNNWVSHQLSLGLGLAGLSVNQLGYWLGLGHCPTVRAGSINWLGLGFHNWPVRWSMGSLGQSGSVRWLGQAGLAGSVCWAVRLSLPSITGSIGPVFHWLAGSVTGPVNVNCH